MCKKVAIKVYGCKRISNIFNPLNGQYDFMFTLKIGGRFEQARKYDITIDRCREVDIYTGKSIQAFKDHMNKLFPGVEIDFDRVPMPTELSQSA